MQKRNRHSGYETLEMDYNGWATRCYVDLKDTTDFLNILQYYKGSPGNQIALTRDECVKLKAWLEEQLWRSKGDSLRDPESWLPGNENE